jgi:hypothetical protein
MEAYSKMIKLLSSVQNALTLKIIFKTYEKGIIDKRELNEYLNTNSMSKLDKAYLKAIKTDIIKLFRLSNGSVQVSLDISLFVCNKCKNKLKRRLDGFFVVECKKDNCEHKKEFNQYARAYFTNNNGIKYIYNAVNVSKQKSSITDKSVWYLRTRYEKRFGRNLKVDKALLRNRMSSMIRLFEGFTDADEELIQKYIRSILKTFKTEDSFSLGKFNDYKQIKNFVKIKKPVKKTLFDCMYCSKHNLYCTYRDNNYCKIEKDGVNCTKTIRKYMEKKYNVQNRT